MKYLVTSMAMDFEPFFTEWFDAKNNYVDGMIVYDLTTHKYTRNGKTWETIHLDHL